MKMCDLQFLDEVDKWGMDIFRLDELSNCRPLTSVVYSIFQVRPKLMVYYLRSGEIYIVINWFLNLFILFSL